MSDNPPNSAGASTDAIDARNVDVAAIARRVVGAMHSPTELRADLIQQGSLLGLDLIRRFQPRTGPDAPAPRAQAERYLYVSLRWQLRGYLRQLRSSVVLSDRDRRLVRDYRALIDEAGPLSFDDAARRLGATLERLASALSGNTTVVSIDRADVVGENGPRSALSEHIAALDESPEQALVTALDDEHANVRQALLRRASDSKSDGLRSGRKKTARRVLLLFLDQLSDVSAELIRLSYGLPRREVGDLPSCRAYGCRLSVGHAHPPDEIAQWIESDPSRVAQRLAQALNDLGELLGGRDPRRLLQEFSAATSAPKSD